MSFYDLYEIEAESLAGAKAILERLLMCSFEERESTYHGGTYYTFGDEAGEHFMLKENRDPFEDVPAEDSFPNSKLLLYVNETMRSNELHDALAESGDAITLLRHEDL
ncbi:hypothetical protein AQZ52_09830 [Novosphingobium fuchskuhlense]|uniref:Uncharacterized protein n=1 Tax=Novosphingobium fuchskuhlense TaxID=1117702 RepID=A0A124JU95_9SPHN|nr:hypothetical protein [Novosphingobium fuchskuhlense]KUR70998.1 hypothetical protein AQZ52_09830 [Novosphingobium fuchskuhlense]